LKKILISLFTVAAVGGLAVGATQAFFSDTETSTGNTFQAGALDLKVDSECHYWQDGVDIGCGEFGNWTETDLEAHKFFMFEDVKPGDFGEDTISLHVIDNDAWGWFTITPTVDSDNGCTEPEIESGDTECTEPSPSPVPGDGELQEALLFNVWLDQGAIPGFQGKGNDTGEGDNIFNHNDFALGSFGPIDENGENYNLWQILSAVRDQAACDGKDNDGDGHTDNPSLDACQGLAEDGRLVGSTTYYFGVEWKLPEEVGNEVQTDRFVADMAFIVEQHRNNPSPSPLPTP